MCCRVSSRLPFSTSDRTVLLMPVSRMISACLTPFSSMRELSIAASLT